MQWVAPNTVAVSDTLTWLHPQAFTWPYYQLIWGLWMLYTRSVWDSCLESNGTTESETMKYFSGLAWLHCLISYPADASRYLGKWLDLTTSHQQTWLFSSTSTYHSTDLLTARGVALLAVHETSGSTSYETIPHVRLETSGDVLSTVDMVAQRRDGPRWLRELDDDDDDIRVCWYFVVLFLCTVCLSVTHIFTFLPWWWINTDL